jgi:hypothetical protein
MNATWRQFLCLRTLSQSAILPGRGSLRDETLSRRKASKRKTNETLKVTRQSARNGESLMYDVNSIAEGVFQPSALLPSQYFDPRPPELTPEKRLMFAVLIDAVRCLEKGLKGPASRKRTLAEVEWWLFRASGDQLFSFDSVCAALEIDADHVRRGLLRWRDQKLAARTSRIIRRSPVALCPRLGARVSHLPRTRRGGRGRRNASEFLSPPATVTHETKCGQRRETVNSGPERET